VKNPITSRAHLLDIPRYLSANSLPPLSPLDDTTPISLSTLRACAIQQGNAISAGDILIVRTGFTEAFLELGKEGQEGLLKREKRVWGGVDAGQEVLEWIWDLGFAAVASDSCVLFLFDPILVAS
jgi:hypothetical protein